MVQCGIGGLLHLLARPRKSNTEQLTSAIIRFFYTAVCETDCGDDVVRCEESSGASEHQARLVEYAHHVLAFDSLFGGLVGYMEDATEEDMAQ